MDALDNLMIARRAVTMTYIIAYYMKDRDIKKDPFGRCSSNELLFNYSIIIIKI